MLTVKNLTLKLGNKNILDNISFCINKNEFISILGPNGAGKSSLLKAIVKIYPDILGDIYFEDENIESINSKKYFQKIAYVPQIFNIIDGITVLEILSFSRFPFMGLYRSLNKVEKKLLEGIIDRFQLASVLNSELINLSGGEAQKVQIACAIFQMPSLLILDEPFSFLDPQIQADIIEILKNEMSLNKISVLMVSHDINQAAIISDRIICLKNGKINYCGNPKDFMQEQQLADAYGDNFLLVDHPNSSVKMTLPRPL